MKKLKKLAKHRHLETLSCSKLEIIENSESLFRKSALATLLQKDLDRRRSTSYAASPYKPQIIYTRRGSLQVTKLRIKCLKYWKY